MPARHARDVLMLGIGALVQPAVAIGFALHYRHQLHARRRRR